MSGAGNHDNRGYYFEWGEKYQGLLEEINDSTDTYDSQANQNIAVVDPDEWDDCNDGASGGPYNSALYSPTIAVSEGISIKLSFDSHYRNESPQQVFLTISHSNGEEEILLHL